MEIIQINIRKYFLLSILTCLCTLFQIKSESNRSDLSCNYPPSNDIYSRIKESINFITEEIRFELIKLQKLFIDNKKVSWCIVSPPKSIESAQRKMKLNNLTFLNETHPEAQINDLARASFIVSNQSDIESVKTHLFNKFGKAILIKDHFSNPKPSGYMDLNIIFPFSNYRHQKGSSNLKLKQRENLKNEESSEFNKYKKINFEIQVHLCNIILVKEIEHIFYEVIRIVEKIVHPKMFEQVIREARLEKEKWEELIRKFKFQGMSINRPKFEMVLIYYNNWAIDKDSEPKAKDFVKATRKFSGGIYRAVMEDYKKNPGECNLLAVDNEICKLNSELMHIKGMEYLKNILK